MTCLDTYRDGNVDMTLCNFHLPSISTPESSILADDDGLNHAYVEN